MRAYTLSVLSSLANSNSPIVEKEIVAWVNAKLVNAAKTSSLRSFQDSTVANGKVVIDLVDSIKPGSINYDLVKNGDTEEVRFFSISIRRQNCTSFDPKSNRFIIFVSHTIGSHCQCQVCHFNGTQNWCACVCTSRGHHRGQAKIGYDSICMPDGHGLHSQYGFD